METYHLTGSSRAGTRQSIPIKSDTVCTIESDLSQLIFPGGSYSHLFALSSKSLLTTGTIQNRCPVGASITHQLLILSILVAPSASSLFTSASMLSDSISMCTRLA